MKAEIRQFNRALEEYLRYNRREQGPLIENRARRIQWELYRRFKAIAPTAQKIMQEAEARGHRTRRRVGKDGTPLSLKDELAVRRRSVKWLSVSFLLRAWKARKEGQAAAYFALSRRKWKVGQTIVRTAVGIRSPSVRIESFLEGAAKQNAQRGIVRQVLRAEVADMASYVARKQREAFQQRFAKLLPKTIHV